ncbi:PREDICTED: uncharacterized protein LOC104823971 [Tarenaya hassleriana]|uniref:uncharacterized protein LOC104823971 n=1 Tax=Tarenaya hassleriana TaxID=28532 RepID=UPI00053C8B75|nr:PREDICTED: uncharacterized protein LOC104823971 [Tarenaya hassleriana]
MDDENRQRAAASTGDRIVISKIMQRFRPIAPKPVPGGCLNKIHDEAFANAKRSAGRNRRSKRKYVRVRNNNKSKNSDNNINSNSNGYNKRKIKSAPTADLDKDAGDDGSGLHKDIVTLQLLPEKEKDLGTREPVFGFRDSVSTGDSTENNYRDPRLSIEDRTIVSLSPLDRTVVESWVTVECVTGTCTDGSIRNQLLGRTDVERLRCLEVDTCPGFVSDGSNRVRWVNGSYRRMMGLTLSGGGDVRVWVVVTEEMACIGELYGAVTCRVRVQYESTWRKKKMTVPCDVWRLGSGGFAWRLDVEAALCLGR